MSWFKVDDGFADHPKVVALQGTARWKGAIALWTLAGSWSSKHLTDGFVPCGVVSRLGGTTSEADALVAAGLWCSAENGYQFHGWNERNPTRSEVEAQRTAGRKRVSQHRVKRAGNALHPEGRTPLPSRPVPTRPDLEQVADPIPLHPDAIAGADPPGFIARLDLAVNLIKQAYEREYAAATQKMYMQWGTIDRPLRDAAKWFAANYPADGSMSPAVGSAVARFFANKRIAENGWSMWKFAEDPGRYMRAPANAPAKHDEFKHDDPDETWKAARNG